MDRDATIVFNGFLQLANLEKLQIVNAINEYFDELEKREAIRSAHEGRFRKLDVIDKNIECKCCGRS